MQVDGEVSVMDLREQRGTELAATRIILRKKGIWLVPSQFGKDKYEINLTPDAPHYTLERDEMNMNEHVPFEEASLCTRA